MPVQTTGATNVVTVTVQAASAQASSSAANMGLASFNSANFTVDANGYVTLVGGGPYYSLTPYIVGPDMHSQYSTIGAAITAAVANGASSSAPANIYIKPQSGGYTENPVLQDGINLIGFNAPNRAQITNIGAQINGKITFSGSGNASIIGLGLNTNGDYLLEITGSNAIDIYIDSCYLNATNANAIHITNSSADIYLNNTNGGCATNTFFIGTAGSIELDYCVLYSTNSTTASTLSAVAFGARHSFFQFPITTSSTSSFGATYCEILATNTTALTHNGSSSSYLKACRLESGTASALSIGLGATLTVTNSEFYSTNTNVLTGAGTLNYAFIGFTASSSGVNVSTVNPLATLI